MSPLQSSPILAGSEDHAPPQQRSLLRSVAVPTEHGGWGLTLESVLLGLAVSWSAAGVCLGVAAFVAFLARTPLKTVLVDARRHRDLPRTRLARRVLVGEAAAMAALTVGAVVLASSAFWMPLIVIAPLVGIELWFDMRSRSRRLIPELAGALGMSGVVALVALAGGSDMRLAIACWMILGARSISAIVTVRDMVGSLHGRPRHPGHVTLAAVVGIVLAGCSVAVDDSVWVGAIAVLLAVVAQWVWYFRPAPRAVVIGVRQTMLGLGVVIATAIGVLAI
jgi:hypothetical protein